MSIMDSGGYRPISPYVAPAPAVTPSMINNTASWSATQRFKKNCYRHQQQLSKQPEQLVSNTTGRIHNAALDQQHHKENRYQFR